MTVAYSREPGPIALGDAIEWGHPDTAGLALSLVGLPGAIGNTWVDLTRKTAGATLAGGATWATTPWGQYGVRSLAGAGLTVTIPYVGYVSGVTFGQSWWLAFTFRPAVYPGGFAPVVDDASRTFSAFVTAAGVPSFGYDKWGTLPPGGSYRLVRTYLSSGGTSGGVAAAYVNGVPTGTGGDVVWSAPVALSLGGNPSGGGNPPDAVYAGVSFGAGRSPTAAEVARDYEWSQDPQRDPRFRRTSTRSLFVTAGGVPTTSYLPGLVCGYGM